MRPKTFVAVAWMLVLSTLALPALALDLTAEQWREDLAVLDEAIRTVHKSPFHTVSEADYTAMVESLHAEIPDLSTQEIIVAMASIVAAVNDGHTRLTGWNGNAGLGFHTYPVALYWFSDGLYVRQAHPEHTDLAGARVLRIGSYTAEEAQAMIERVVPADNRHGERDEGARRLASREVMLALGILDPQDTTPYEFEKDGRTWSPELDTLPGAPDYRLGFVAESAGWVDARDTSATPLWMSHLGEVFWFEYLPGEKLLYVQENAVRNGPLETQEAFYSRVRDAIAAHDVETLVLDVRLNGGGNNYLNKPALTTMVRADATAKTFVIIGRQTFSACQNLVNELSRWSDAVFVGEPTAERVNFYGDTRATELPNSALTVRASWLWWQNMDPRDTRDALYPDVAADLSFADYVRNHDPALAAIRNFGGLLTDDEVIAIIDDEGLEAARARLRTAIGNPVFRYRSMEAEINNLGYRLLQERRTEDAIGVFSVNTEEFPDSWNAWDSLGDALETAGDRDRALEYFERSLSLNPTSPTGLAAVERLRGGGGSSSDRRH